MKRIPYTELQQGYYCDKPLWLDESFTLLAPNMPITQTLLQHLRNWGYNEVFTNGILSDNPMSGTLQGDKAVSLINEKAVNDEVRKKIKDFYESFIDHIFNLYRQLLTESALNFEALTSIIKEIIDLLKDNRDYLLRLPDLYSNKVAYFINYAARITIIVIAIGEQLKLPQFKLLELGVAGLFSQLGMMQIPRRVYEKSDLTATDKKIIALHPVQGVNLLNNVTRQGKWALSLDVITAIGQQNGRLNGTGTPSGLTDKNFLQYGRILSVAATFNYGISDRPHGAGANGHLTMLSIMKGIRTLYDEHIVKALLMALSLYPTGNYVQLENKTIGIIVKNDESDPRTPTIRILLDEKLRPVQQYSSLKIQPGNTPGIIKILNNKEIAMLSSHKLIQD